VEGAAGTTRVAGFVQPGSTHDRGQLGVYVCVYALYVWVSGHELQTTIAAHSSVSLPESVCTGGQTGGARQCFKLDLV